MSQAIYSLSFYEASDHSPSWYCITALTETKAGRLVLFEDACGTDMPYTQSAHTQGRCYRLLT